MRKFAFSQRVLYMWPLWLTYFVDSLCLLHRRLCLTSIPAQLVQRRLLWISKATRRPEGELTRNLLLPTPPREWHRRIRAQLKTWETILKEDLEPLSGRLDSS